MKTVFKVLMGALLIPVIVFAGGRLYFSMKKKEYRQQLENAINNKYLEGKDAIGAYYYDRFSVRNGSIGIQKVSNYTASLDLTLLLRKTSCWAGQYFDHTVFVIEVLKSGIYKWFDFYDCATSFPFMIIVKKRIEVMILLGNL